MFVVNGIVGVLLISLAVILPAVFVVNGIVGVLLISVAVYTVNSAFVPF